MRIINVKRCNYLHDGRTSKTDNNGKFEFRNLETKKYKLSVNLEGFYPYETEIDIAR